MGVQQDLGVKTDGANRWSQCDWRVKGQKILCSSKPENPESTMLTQWVQASYVLTSRLKIFPNGICSEQEQTDDAGSYMHILAKIGSQSISGPRSSTEDHSAR